MRLPGFAARLTAVVRQVSPLRHARVVGSIDTATGDSALAVVTEPVDGIPLSGILVPGEALPPATAMEIVDDVLRAVGAAHAMGIVHCGVEPGRVLITAAGDVRLDGFAMARALGLTGGDAAAPTPGFASPERLGGALPDGMGDLYSAAALAHLLLAGSTPTPGVARPVPALPGMQEILVRALAADPKRRYPSASALRGALASTAAETLGEDWRSGSDLGKRAAEAIAARDAELAPEESAPPPLAIEPPPAAPLARPAAPPRHAAPPPRPAAAPRPPPRPVRPGPRERRGRALLFVLLAIVLLGGAGGGAWYLATRSSGSTAPPGPLGVGSPITLDVARSTASGAQCDATFTFTAKGPLRGQGDLVYHFEQSDGHATPDTTIHITTETSFSLDHLWRFQGSMSGSATLTFVITKPPGANAQPTKVAKTFDITCPPGQ